MLSDTRILAALAVLAGVAMLGGAFAFQHLGGLDPCVLCIYQRWAWVAVIAAGSLALLAALMQKPRWSVLLLAATSLAMLTSAGLAAFHVGVEQHWWAGTSECGGITGKATSIEDLKRQLMATPVIRCDQVAWSLAGISMAGWNMILSLIGTVLLTWRLLALQRRHP